MDYKHGIYGESGSVSGIADISQGTVPVYIGTLPVHRINSEKLSKVKHGKSENCIMLLLTSYNEVKALNIYSDDWEAYSLCEAINAHFINGATAPIVLIANGEAEAADSSTEATVPVVKSGTSYIGYLNDSKAMIDSIAITAPSVTFSDGDVSYEYEGDRIKIVIAKADFKASSVGVTYNAVKGEKLTTTEFAEALALLDRVENITVRVPNILCAPQYSDDSQFHDLMVQKAIEKVAGKWNLICMSDLPATIISNEAAIAWKKTNSYNNVLDKVFFPKLSYGGKAYHMSVVATAKMQELDIENGNIPFVSVSNKPVVADNLVNGSGDTIYLSELEANELNKNGITTAISMKGQIRTWGSHMANYDFENLSAIADEDRFDVATRMSVYMKNYLQYNYLDEIDNTVTRKDIDSIINSVQMWLDSLVNSGMLLYATVELDGDSDLVNGDVAFNLYVTYPFVMKSITFRVIYTDAGLSVLKLGEEGGNE